MVKICIHPLRQEVRNRSDTKKKALPVAEKGFAGEPPIGIEPTTCYLRNSRSNHLS